MDRRLPLFISLILFAVGMGWFSRGLVFPPFYHPDEINKVVQLDTGWRNFNHPQLMLNSAQLVHELAGSPESKLRIAVITRWVSVFFAAMTVVLMSYTAWLLAGPVAQVACGWLLLTKPLLFELAHYLKEDPALAMGFGAIYLTFLLYDRRRTPGQAAWVGFAAGLAASAKYIGIFPAVLALGGVLWLSDRRARHLAWFLIPCALTVIVFNWQAVVQLTGFRSGLGREIGLFAEHSTDSLVNAKNIGGVSDEIGVIAWLALAAWLASPLYRRRKLSVAEWLMLVATFGYAGMLLFSSRSANRYLLPVAASLPMIMAVGACWVGAWLAGLVKKSPTLIQASLCLVILIVYGARDVPGLQKLYAGFHGDTHRDAVAYIRAHLPPDAVLAEDDEVKLPDGTPRRTYEGWDLTLRRVTPDKKDHLGEEFTVAELRERGVTHVVLFVDGDTKDAIEGKKRGGKKEKFETFVSELEKNNKVLWSCETTAPAYLNPPLRLYEISPGR